MTGSAAMHSSVLSGPTPHPIPATIAVVFRGRSVLLVRRANPPDATLWGFPGGKIDFGESIERAAVRELYEETGIRADAGPVFTAVDAFDGAAGPDAKAHYVLIAVLCHWRAGEPQAGDDALEARWHDLDNLEHAGLAMSFGVASVARQAFAIWQDGPTRPDVPQ